MGDHTRLGRGEMGVSGLRPLALVVWLAFVAVGAESEQNSAYAVRDGPTHAQFQDSDKVSPLGDESLQADVLLQMDDAERKISGMPLPCCLQNPVPAGCKCYLVKADAEKATASVREETNEAKQKAGEAAMAAGVSADKEK